jgi:hypothetical protein
MQTQDDFTLGPSKSTIQRLTWTLSSGIKNPGREANNTPQAIAENKNERRRTFLYPSTTCTFILLSEQGLIVFVVECIL